jgi:hypothetical protein
MTYYYITSNDPDPRNCSCTRFIIDENLNYIDGNNEGSTSWDNLVTMKEGIQEACQYLIDELNDEGDYEFGVKREGCWISIIPEDEADTFF